jgi:hypothetical protein
MKKRRKKPAAKASNFRVWTHAQAEAALPYLTSVMRSVREEYLQTRVHRSRCRRLRGRPGRPDRQALLAQEAAAREAAEAEARFEDVLQELWRANVYCLDPAQGLALVPFAHEDQLAWFVLDLFDPKRLSSWRFHADPLETRRPLSEAVTAAPPRLVV